MRAVVGNATAIVTAEAKKVGTVSAIKLDRRGKTDQVRDVHVLIEMTDKCNHRCIMCKHGFGERIHGNLAPRFIEPGLFMKVINELKTSRLKVVSLDPLWAGESLMHPQFKELISYLFLANKAHRICRGVVLNTNACFLDEEITNIFLDYGRFVQKHAREGFYFRLYFSLDAVVPQTYAKIRRTEPAELERVVRNIHLFMEKRVKAGLVVPNTIFVFLVMEENRDEAKGFLLYWKRYLNKLGVRYEVTPTWPLETDRDAIYFRQLICPDMQKAVNLHAAVAADLELVKKKPGRRIRAEVSKKSNKPPPEQRRVCAALWRSPNVQASGIVTPCCRDIDLSLNMGNLTECSLDEIWFGEKLRRLRQAHVQGDLSDYPTCAACPEYEGSISINEAKQLLAQD